MNASCTDHGSSLDGLYRVERADDEVNWEIISNETGDVEAEGLTENEAVAECKRLNEEAQS